MEVAGRDGDDAVHARLRRFFGMADVDDVMEDEPAIALGLRNDLAFEGYDVEVAGDGETASRRAREAAFDLILLDVMLPRKDGFAVCRELRRSGSKAAIIRSR